MVQTQLTFYLYLSNKSITLRRLDEFDCIHLTYLGGPQGVMRGQEANDFLDYQERNAERLRAEGRTRRHYWGSGRGSEALAFDGQPEVDQLARGEMPTHLAPFINHCDEGRPEYNVQGVHIRVSFYCVILV